MYKDLNRRRAHVHRHRLRAKLKKDEFIRRVLLHTLAFTGTPMRIEISTIGHGEQRYSTAGDWWVDNEGALQVRVSRLSDPRYEALVAIHELVEALTEAVKRTGKLEVPEELVQATDKFDKEYEVTRAADDKESEPGYEPECPVYEGHMAASAIENIVAMLLKVNYNDYAEEIASLS